MCIDNRCQVADAVLCRLAYVAHAVSSYSTTYACSCHTQQSFPLTGHLCCRASKLFSTDLTTQKPGIYGDDQDPSFSSEKDLEYAKSYGRQLQTLSVKDTGSAPTTAAQVRAAIHTPFLPKF